ncbi:MFS transporter [Rhizocola hellebori]|uniref:MFS transporter n=1 Tax=Rhizocola hellebori TaxID=1392758 RepID=A0A8J3QIJ8_9ACTN|nr:MFS transporter [Rhizocola hellebori]GIH11296.1 MFS transporter [Rhizocola hellebori]
MAISACYHLTGALTALWGAALPATDTRLNLGPGRLGNLLLILGIGAIIAMPAAGRLADRTGSRRLLRLAGPLCALGLGGPAIATSPAWLFCATFVLGLLMGTLNVALNTQAVLMERQLSRPIMSTLHGTWTLGAVLGGAAVTAGLHPAIGAFLLAILFWVPAKALPTPQTPPLPTAVTAAAVVPGALPGFPILAALGVLGGAAFLTEGTAIDWAGIHAQRVLGATPATGSLVYTLFFVSMTIVRFTGDRVRARLGPPRTLLTAGLTAASGYALILVAPLLIGGLFLAIAGWCLTAAGMALVWPVIASAIGTAGNGTAKGLSTVTTISYAGTLAGPALIGYVASTSSLTMAMILPAVLALVVALAGPPILRSIGRHVSGLP